MDIVQTMRRIEEMLIAEKTVARNIFIETASQYGNDRKQNTAMAGAMVFGQIISHQPQAPGCINN